jgi:hypothetical protein
MKTKLNDPQCSDFEIIQALETYDLKDILEIPNISLKVLWGDDTISKFLRFYDNFLKTRTLCLDIPSTESRKLKDLSFLIFALNCSDKKDIHFSLNSISSKKYLEIFLQKNPLFVLTLLHETPSNYIFGTLLTLFSQGLLHEEDLWQYARDSRFNFSSETFFRSELLGHLMRALRRSGLSPTHQVHIVVMCYKSIKNHIPEARQKILSSTFRYHFQLHPLILQSFHHHHQ